MYVEIQVLSHHVEDEGYGSLQDCSCYEEVDKQRICSLSEGDKLNNSGCSIWYDTA